MATPSSSSSTQEKSDPSETVATQFLANADDYFRSEIKLVASDYDCLNQMNSATWDKYNQMHRKLQYVNSTIRTMNDTNCSKILSTHAQLKEIEETMSNIESTLMKLDGYSRSLEAQIKKYEKTMLTNRITSPTKD